MRQSHHKLCHRTGYVGVSPSVREHGGVQVVGRERELAAVEAFLGPDAGVPSAVLLEGEPGMGKTTIVRAAVARASSAGLRVFLARPAVGEAELPYVGLGDLLASAGFDSLASLAGPQRVAIEAALAREGSSEAVDRHALSRGVLDLLRLEGASGKLLVVVDDVQWLDRPTVTTLTFALRRVPPEPIRVLLAVRTEGDPSVLPFGLAEWEDVRRVKVGPLAVTELGVVLRHLRGEHLPRPALEALWRTSGGNPMFALELAGARQGAGAPTLLLALQGRLQGLDEQARSAIGVAAAALRPSTDLLLRAGVSGSELGAALDTGVLEANGTRLSFAHPLLGAAAYELLAADERRRIHARLASAAPDAVEGGHHVSRSAIGRDELATRVSRSRCRGGGRSGRSRRCCFVLAPSRRALA